LKWRDLNLVLAVLNCGSKLTYLGHSKKDWKTRFGTPGAGFLLPVMEAVM
jgi:hypothetical protein